MKHKTKLILIALIPLQYIALLILRNFPETIEKYYSEGIFPVMAKVARYVFGWVPFSVGDIIYLGLIIFLIRWLYFNIRRLRKEPAKFLLDVGASFSIIYLVFNMVWSLNYLRPPLHKTLNLGNDYTTEQLIATTNRLIKKSNELHRTLGYKDSVMIVLPYTQQEIFEKSLNGYKNLETEFPSLKYSPKSVKKSMWSLGLTYMGYSGYYNPLTGEAQVNSLIKNYKFPVVSCHEMAHQIGFAAENEANFLAMLATTNNDDLYFQYAGYIFALRYCINEIARRDIDTYHAILPTVNFGILESYREMREFWASYENPFEDLSKAFWDQFLKANNQSKGIMSYSYMVALVVNYFDGRPL